MRLGLVLFALAVACSSKPDEAPLDGGAGGEPAAEGGAASAGTNGQAAGQGGDAPAAGSGGVAAGAPSGAGTGSAGEAPVCQTVGAPITFGECSEVERLECGATFERMYKVGDRLFGPCENQNDCPDLQVHCRVFSDCQPTNAPETSFAHCLHVQAVTCSPKATPGFTTENGDNVFAPCDTVDTCEPLKAFCRD